MIRKMLLAAFAFVATAAHAAPNQAAIEARVKGINPDAVIASIKPTPVNGLNEVLAGGQVLYLSDDGRYLFHGSLLDMQERINITEIAASKVRAELINSVPDAEKIIFKPAGKPKHVVRVFTDISCGYCKKLHEGIQDYLKAGIQVEYLAFPRGGEQSPAFGEMKAIWCANNPKVAYEAAIMGEEPNSVPCADPVLKHYALGDKVGIQGTPAIFSMDGVQLGGYLPAPEMLNKLDAKARVAKAREDAAGEPKAP